jgi:8-oxo-dGTP pyrophosphatase MutT (NUDIX family)
MKKEISWISKTARHNRTGFYEDTDDFSKLPAEKIGAVCAFCYYDGKYIIVKNGLNWEPVAGHVEPGETPEQALVREIKEESNMKILKYFPVGYLYIREVDIYQTRYFCEVVPYGPFVSDPDGGVTEIKIIDPADIFKFVNSTDTSLSMVPKCLKIIEKIKNKVE